MADVWTSIPDRTTSDNYSNTDANAWSQAVRILGGNGTSQPSSDIESIWSLVSSLNTNIKYLTSADDPFTITDSDGYGTYICDSSGGDINITLPTLADNQKRAIEIIHSVGGNVVNVDGEGAESIDGLSDIDLPKQADRIKILGSTSLWAIQEERISCQLRLDTYAGYGSTDTDIMRFTNKREGYGNMFAENHTSGYASNAEGLEIVVARQGKYSFTFWIQVDTNMSIGLSLNSSQLTTGIVSINITDALAIEKNATAADYISCSWTGWLAASDTIRAHSNAVAPVGNIAGFTATYIGN